MQSTKVGLFSTRGEFPAHQMLCNLRFSYTNTAKQPVGDPTWFHIVLRAFGFIAGSMWELVFDFISQTASFAPSTESRTCLCRLHNYVQAHVHFIPFCIILRTIPHESIYCITSNFGVLWASSFSWFRTSFFNVISPVISKHASL